MDDTHQAVAKFLLQYFGGAMVPANQWRNCQVVAQWLEMVRDGRLVVMERQAYDEMRAKADLFPVEQPFDGEGPEPAYVNQD